MIKVVFHGHLKRFGSEFSLEAENAAEVVRALCLQIPGLEEVIKAGNWHVIRGRLEDQDDLSEEMLTLPFGTVEEMHLLPAIEGSGSGGGILSVVVGAALIVAGALTANPMLIAAGAGMMLGGIVMMTMKIPTADTDQNTQEERASFLFGKPTNSTKQGGAIPRGYGKFRSGSVVVSSSVVAEQLLDSEGNEIASSEDLQTDDDWPSNWPTNTNMSQA